MDNNKIYTKVETAEKCFNHLKNLFPSITEEKFIEPSAGNGNWLSFLPNYIALDLSPEDEKIIQKNFLDYTPEGKEYITIGRPPWGSVNKTTIKFFNHAANFSNIIAFILPESFKNYSKQKFLDLNFKLLSELSLPFDSFIYEDGEQASNIKSVFQIWVKKNSKFDNNNIDLRKYEYNVNPIIHGQIFITHQCQLNCSYCYEDYEDNEVISLDICKKIINYLINNNTDNEVQNISFFGGEPLLHFKDIIKPVIEWNKNELKNSNLRFSFVTNGLLLNEEILQYCKNNDINFMLSIDGNKESQDSTRKFKLTNDSSFDTLSKNIPNILKYFPNTTARMTVDPNNVQYLFQSIKFFDEQGFQNCNVIPNLFCNWSESSILEYKNQLALLNEYFIEKFNNYEIPLLPATWKEMMIRKIIKDYSEEHDLFRNAKICSCENRCGFGFQKKAFFETNGDIFTCTHLTKENKNKNSNFYLGNINDDIPINVEKIKKLYKLNENNDITNKNCSKECSLYRMCTGGCLPNNYLINNNLFIVPDIYCIWYRNLFESIENLLYYFDNNKNNILFKNYFYGTVVKGGIQCVC